MATELIKERGARRRREREAAIFLADIVLSVLNFTRLANRSQTIGQPWGPFTIGYFLGALKQKGFYEANRVKLFDLRDLKLRGRAEIHIHAQFAYAQNIIDHSQAIESLEEELELLEANAPDARKHLIEEKLKHSRFMREVALKGLSYNLDKSEELVASLEPVAGVKFGSVNQFEIAVSNMQTALSKFAKEFDVIDGEVIPKEENIEDNEEELAKQ
ncbi:hypothetical protein [Parasphingorhabdus sp.]|uniref:hypothetical protein n=1 Tax=Parasphingorhabdus sp. TaxID=2709688 RepID=UPI003BAE630A